MRPELERLQRIERHLRGESQPADAPDWNVQLLLDPDLRADAEAQQLLYQGLYSAGRRQLRRELTAIHNRLYGTPRSGWFGKFYDYYKYLTVKYL
ncbi:hypothetical protein [Hymenobacter jejuensis]|uniref:Uncharacterized protein n=1 Tax=Hymenobacter jejuensis TaxID=2502781 RepID=A0A5B8A2R1_9BACT|nr:hypothetical protein [Hymenobacter jejuensis]QDA61457.1 hypothetical protein FHG12_15725 [Hymenobacter jejuensis]